MNESSGRLDPGTVDQNDACLQGMSTPGPWYVEECRGTDGRICFFDVHPVRSKGKDYRGPVASCSNAENIRGITQAEARANAHVISLLPEMLRELKWFAENEGECVADYPKRLARIRAFIAKATGAAS